MREIKFRAWNIEDKTMGIPFTLQTAVGSRSHNGVDTKNVIYLEFTGLKDKNGKEIYEGDILELTIHSGVYVVAFENAEYVIYRQQVERDMTFHLGGYKQEVINVIGNIYENPELLNNNKAA